MRVRVCVAATNHVYEAKTLHERAAIDLQPHTMHSRRATRSSIKVRVFAINRARQILSLSISFLTIAGCSATDQLASGGSEQPGGVVDVDGGTSMADGGTSMPDGGETGGTTPDSQTPGGTTPDGQTPDGGTPTPAAWLHGVTVDDVSGLNQITASLQALPHRATTRIVFDEGQSPSAYATAVPAIAAVSDVMGELLDSYYVPTISVSGYVSRASDYLAAFGNVVDIWEVGNEINGSWVDNTPGGVSDVVAKMAGAYDLVHAAGKKTALTLYGCDDDANAYKMLVWATANVPDRMKTGLDYVLVSFYEGDCGVAAPDWQTTFHKLRLIFPNAALGFGEVGAVTTNGNRIADPAIAGPYLQRYYDMPITEPGYIGGHFWWYYVEDMLPYPSSMHTTLSSAIQ